MPSEVRNHPVLAARALALLFALAAALGLITAIAPGSADIHGPTVAMLSVVGLVVPLILVVTGSRLPEAALQAGLALGTLTIAAGIYATGGVPNAGSTLFAWVAIYAFYFFSWRAAVVHLLWIATVFALLIHVQPPGYSGVGMWIAIVLTTGVAGACVGLLKDRLAKTIARLEWLADTDPMTGAANRRGLGTRAALEITRAMRTGEPLAVAVIDLDDFKRFNDTQGHAAGDRLLSDAVAGWTAALRDMDFLARVGGDEFVVVLPGTDEDGARAVADRLEEAMPRGGSCSIGVAEWRQGETLDEPIRRADTDLYREKRELALAA